MLKNITIENVKTRTFPIRVKANAHQLEVVMFTLAYRNAAGALRVTPEDTTTFDSLDEAKAAAKYWSGIVGRTVSLLPTGAMAEAAYDAMSWQDKGWYCQHSYEFCTPCFAGYDHPADEYADYVANAIATAEANGIDLDATHGPWS